MMIPLSPDKYTVAWFTLAAFIARKEKERALGIYRLLTHSLHDEALAYQLEGDILLSFSDEKALDAYTKAAKLYEQQGALVQSAAVYEHLITLVPDCLAYVHKLLYLYTIQALDVHIRRTLTYLATLYGSLLHHALSTHTLDQADRTIQESIALLVCDQHKAFVCAQIVLGINTHTHMHIDTAKKYIVHALGYFKTLPDTTHLHHFLNRLLEHNQALYTYAHECMFTSGI